MPLSVVLAFSGLALLWGWPVEAPLPLMTWTGIRRISEVLDAFRKDLVLPEDAAPGTWFALAQIRQPKIRGSTTHHQFEAVFGKLPRKRKLGPLWGQVLRRRFQMLQKVLGLLLVRLRGQAPFDLASLCLGGATFLPQHFEDAKLVRRQGRWLSASVLRDYLLEVRFATFRDRLPPVAFARISKLSASF